MVVIFYILMMVAKWIDGYDGQDDGQDDGYDNHHGHDNHDDKA